MQQCKFTSSLKTENVKAFKKDSSLPSIDHAIPLIRCVGKMSIATCLWTCLQKPSNR